jgi:hypothetical protein
VYMYDDDVFSGARNETYEFRDWTDLVDFHSSFMLTFCSMNISYCMLCSFRGFSCLDM